MACPIFSTQSGRTRSLVAGLATISIVVGACAAGTPSQPTPATTATPQVIDETLPPPPPSAEVVTATWISPKASAKVTAYKVKLSVRPEEPPGGAAVAKVVFRAKWSDRTKVACSATRPAAGGTWSCTANLLKLGIPPGKVTFSFEMSDSSGRVENAPADPRKVTYAVAPPKPTKVRMKLVKSVGFTWTYRVTWSEPDGYASRFRLFYVNGCPNYPKSPTGSPCLAERTPLSQGALTPVASAKGTARSLTFRRDDTGACAMQNGLFCDTTGAVVLGAYNSYGESVLAIVKSAKVVPDWKYYKP